MNTMDRREFLAAAGTLVGLAGCSRSAGTAVIDFHQHTHYLGRSDADLVAHQRKLGVAKTVAAPGRLPLRPGGGMPGATIRW